MRCSRCACDGVRRTLCDGTGSFTIAGLTPGAATVVARAADHGLWRGSVTIMRGDVATLAPVRHAGAQVTGTVKSLDGQPVAGCFVSSTVEPEGLLLGLGAATTESAADGTFELASVPTGHISMSVQGPGVDVVSTLLETQA